MEAGQTLLGEGRRNGGLAGKGDAIAVTVAATAVSTQPAPGNAASSRAAAAAARGADAAPAPSLAPAIADAPGLLATANAHAAFLLWTLIIFIGLLGVPSAWALVALISPTPAGWATAALITLAAAWAALVPLPPDRAPPHAFAAALSSYLISGTLRFLKPHPDGSPGLRVLCAPGAAAALARVGSTPLLLAAEPHSVLPMGALLALHPAAQPLLHPAFRPPPSLVGARLLASSACFTVPLVRHVWWWLGLRPADRETMRAGFAAARAGRGPAALALCPGGVAEVALLTPTPPPGSGLPKTETLYLKSRTGFVRETLRAGAALVPVFCLGQTALFRWTHPPFRPRPALERLARAIGFMPLWAHNGWGVP